MARSKSMALMLCVALFATLPLHASGVIGGLTTSKDLMGNWSAEASVEEQPVSGQATTYNDYEWLAYNDYDLPTLVPDFRDVEQMEASDMEAVKRRVIEQGYEGFSVSNGFAFMKETPRALTKDDLVYIGGSYPVVFYIRGPKVEPQQQSKGGVFIGTPSDPVGLEAAVAAAATATQAAAVAQQVAEEAMKAIASVQQSQVQQPQSGFEAPPTAPPLAWDMLPPAPPPAFGVPSAAPPSFGAPGAATFLPPMALPNTLGAAPPPSILVDSQLGGQAPIGEGGTGVFRDPLASGSLDSAQVMTNVAALCVIIAVYSLFMKSVVQCFAKEAEGTSTAYENAWLESDGELPPLMATLEGMRPAERVDGAAVKKALKYSNLLDLMVSTPNMVFDDPSARASLCHADLSTFVRGVDLSGLGLAPGDRVACLVPNGPEAAVLLLACFAKCTVVPLNPTSTQQEIVLDAGRVRAKVLIAHRDYMENVKQSGELLRSAAELGIGLFTLSPDDKVIGRFSMKHVTGTQVPSPSVSRRLLSGPEDTSLLLFTSGTSGSKKCVPYTLNTLVIGSANIISSWELRQSDRVCNMMPLFHVGGITRNVLSPVLSGGSAVLCSSFDPIQFWDIVQSRNNAVTWYYAGPVMHQLILDEFKARGMSHYKFRFIANAAGGLLPSLAVEMRSAYGCTILPGYGMTECMPISAPPLSYKLDREGTSGRAVGPQLKIFSDSGEDLPSGAVGNIVVKGPPLFQGYEGDPEATKEAFFKGDWFNTGDLGWLDQDGYLYITGRSKEVINRGGEIISPFEVEEAIQSHPCVKACIAFSVPHDILEEGIGIAIVAEEGKPRPSLRSIQRWCKESLSFAKWPQVLVLMPDLPKNHANKTLRVKLADRLNLKKFWNGAMVDGMPEVSRTFLGGCPAQGASLKEPIPNVSMVSIDVESIGRRLREAGADLGVKEAAAAQVGNDKRLCACVTPDNVDIAKLLARIRGLWDEWEVPLVVSVLSNLPRATNADGSLGAVDRGRLERLLEVVDPDYIGPSTKTEELVQSIWEQALDKPRISIDADFFDLGGTSLLVGPLALTIQDELKISFTAVDIFSTATIKAVCDLIEQRRAAEESANATSPPLSRSSSKGSHAGLIPAMAVQTERPWGSTHPMMIFYQSVPFFVIQPLYRLFSWLVFVHLFVWTSSFYESRCLTSVLATILATQLIMSIASPVIFIIAKWTLVGTYKERQYPIFGGAYLRWWMVNQLYKMLSRGIFVHNLPLFYRLLGAKIGADVGISEDAKLSEFDLLRIGAGTALDNCTLRPFCMSTNGCFTLRNIELGQDCSVAAKTVIAGGARLNSGTCLGPLSSSHELQDARPENRLSCRVLRAQPPMWLQVLCGWPVLLLQKIVALTPVLLLMQKMTTQDWYDGTLVSLQDGLDYISTPQRMAFYISFMVTRKVISPPLALAMAILTKRFLIGTFTETPEGQQPDRSNWELFRTWLLGRMIPDAHLCGVTKLLGRHYEAVSFLYRLLGVKVGKYVYWPGSGFKFMEPDLVELGDYVVFGSRSLFLTSDSSHRRQTIKVEAGSNVSDRCVLLPGTTVKCGVILGSGALTKQGTTYNAGTYVGSRGNECVMLKRASSSTPPPTESSYARAFMKSGRMPYLVLPEAFHVLWSTACITLAAVTARMPLVLALLLANYHFRDEWADHGTVELIGWIAIFMLCMYPCVLALVLTIDIGSKWFFIGLRVPGSHSWDTSSYSQRWQLYLSLAPIRSFASGDQDFLDFFRGSQFLVWYYRALGATIGRNVCLYPNGADPMMTEPELVTIRDGACIDDCSLTAHLNTQGVFTLNRLEVGERCVMRAFSRLQQSAVMEPRSVLMEHTLVLPADTVKANEWRQGWPSGRGVVEEDSDPWEESEQDVRRNLLESRALLCC